jgi:hypothetical protein
MRMVMCMSRFSYPTACSQMSTTKFELGLHTVESCMRVLCRLVPNHAHKQLRAEPCLELLNVVMNIGRAHESIGDLI